MTQTQQQSDQIFYPYLVEKRAEVQAKKLRFAHYTSAEVALRILQNKSVWMRNSVTMNDFEEVQYGMNALITAYKGDTGNQLKAVLESLFPGAVGEFEQRFDALADSLRKNTYLMSFSEHPKEEDECGRLSMWRAYGGSCGVAVVIRPEVFSMQTTALSAYSNPVVYGADQLNKWFLEIIANCTANAASLQHLGKDAFLVELLSVCRFAVLSTKHPGFAEEREWRVIHSLEEPSELLKKEVEVVRGIPQLVCKIPLKDVPEHGVSGLSFDALVDRIIIGPTNHPLVVHEAFECAMKDAGINGVSGKLQISNIPLRQP